MKKAVKQSAMLRALNFGTILLVIILAIAFFFSISMNNQAVKMYENEKELTMAAQQFIDGSGYLTDQARACAATGDKSYYENYQNEVNNLKNRETGYNRMKKVGITADEDALIQEMSQISNDLVPLEENAMDAAMAGNINSAIEYVFGTEYSTSLEEIQALQQEFLNRTQTRLTAEIQQLRANVSAVQVVVVLIVCVIIAFQVFATLFTRKKIIQPLKTIESEMLDFSRGNLSTAAVLEENTSELGMLAFAIHQMRARLKEYITDIQDKLTRLSNGDFRTHTDVEYAGDFSEIKTAIERISNVLSDVFREIDTAANQVAAGADQVSSGAQALSQGSTEQASSVEELSATVQEISRQIDQNAKETNSANELTSSTGDKITEAKGKMEQLVAAMAEIGETSQQIQTIIKTIDDIAFQTNILALNAAVEAARAGTAGKGFAVVADEVRNLAGKSAEASQTTQELIANSIQAVARGNDLAADTAGSLTEITEAATQVVEAIAAITEASAAQAEAVDQIALGLDQVSSVVQTNSATAEESAAASEELSGQASMLKDLVSKFKTSDHGMNRLDQEMQLPAQSPMFETSAPAFDPYYDKY